MADRKVVVVGGALGALALAGAVAWLTSAPSSSVLDEEEATPAKVAAPPPVEAPVEPPAPVAPVEVASAPPAELAGLRSRVEAAAVPEEEEVPTQDKDRLRLAPLRRGIGHDELVDRLRDGEALPADLRGVDALLDERLDDVDRCFRAEAPAPREDEDRVTLRFTLGATPDGSGARITGIDSPGDARGRYTAFRSCIAEVMGDATFAAPGEGGAVSVTRALLFEEAP